MPYTYLPWLVLLLWRSVSVYERMKFICLCPQLRSFRCVILIFIGIVFVLLLLLLFVFGRCAKCSHTIAYIHTFIFIDISGQYSQILMIQSTLFVQVIQKYYVTLVSSSPSLFCLLSFWKEFVLFKWQFYHSIQMETHNFSSLSFLLLANKNCLHHIQLRIFFITEIIANVLQLNLNWWWLWRWSFQQMMIWCDTDDRKKFRKVFGDKITKCQRNDSPILMLKIKCLEKSYF